MLNEPVEMPKQGQVSYNLSELSSRVASSIKLAEEILDKLSYPRSVACDGQTLCAKEELTLAQKISLIDNQVDGVNAKLLEILDILREQLGEEKLI